MAHVNENYNKLPGNYLFQTIAKKVADYEKKTDRQVIRLGIGDVTKPLAPAIIEALHKAVDDMATAETFHGYGPEQGYDFLRHAIIKGDYETRGVSLDTDEVFIGDGAKTDVACIQEIFGHNLTFAIADPVYPVYLDSNVMFGHTGAFNEKTGRYDGVVYLPCTPENGFKATPPTEPVDIVFEIDGAKEVAIELRSFSKNAGFTGTRCSYVVVPKACVAYTHDGIKTPLNPMWNRRQCTFFNGTPYIIQRAAEAYYSEEGQKQCRADVAYYMENARIIRDGLTDAGYTVYGALNSPYAWVQTPKGMKSWDFFDLLLEQAGVVTTPGSGFGPHGEGYMRLTAFGSRENTVEAVDRIKKLKF